MTVVMEGSDCVAIEFLCCNRTTVITEWLCCNRMTVLQWNGCSMVEWLWWNCYRNLPISRAPSRRNWRTCLGNIFKKLHSWFQETIEGSSSSHSSEDGMDQEWRRLLSAARSTTALFKSPDVPSLRIASGTIMLSHKQQAGSCSPFIQSLEVMIKHPSSFVSRLSIVPQ